MRRLLFCSFHVFFGFACKTTHKNQSGLNILQRTPQGGIAGIIDQVPLLIEPGKPAVVTINRMAGTPPADSALRLSRIELSIKPADGYKDCKSNLTAAVFTELVEKDIERSEDFQAPASYRSQEISLSIQGDAEKGWTLATPGGHDIGDLYLSFDAAAVMTCQVSAVGHGFYAVNSTGAWGEGSGDGERDRMVRAWGSDRGHRLWHYLWHGMRSQWPQMDESDRKALTDHYGPNIAPPARNPQGKPDGEDFLYMHHKMLKAISQHLASKGKVMVPAWKVLPRFDDKKFPSANVSRKQEDYDAWERDYLDVEKVKAMTLGEYGELIEQTIHNSMHMRFLNPADMRGPSDPLDPEWEKKYSKLYDDPAFDYLGGTYSSHVNPVFFMLHGWVDDRIQTWLDAHGYKSIGSENECNQKSDCYVWLSSTKYAEGIDRRPWEGVTPGASRSGAGLHNHSIPTGPVPQLSLEARALLSKTRRMGGF